MKQRVAFKVITFGVLILGAALALYFFKCYEGMDIFKNGHLSGIVPFSYAATMAEDAKIVPSKTYGTILDLKSANYTGFSLWACEANSVKIVSAADDGGWKYLRIINSEGSDWSYTSEKYIEVLRGDSFNYSVKIKKNGGKAKVAAGLILYSDNKKVENWYYAKSDVLSNNASEWVTLRKEFLIPAGVKYIKFRLTGSGLGEALIDDVVLKRQNPRYSVEPTPKIYYLENDWLQVKLSVDDNILSVMNKRCGSLWESRDAFNGYIVKEVVSEDKTKLKMKVTIPETMRDFQVDMVLVPDSPEVDFEIKNFDAKQNIVAIDFPPFLYQKDVKALHIVAPLQEGIIMPMEDAIKDFPKKIRYSGSWSMPFIGIVSKERGWCEIVDTPYDFEIIKNESHDGGISLNNRWLAEKGYFGYTRKIKYCFFSDGGYMSFIDRYRAEVKDKYCKRLFNKRVDAKRDDNLDKLIGAVDIWYWGADESFFLRDLIQSGVKKAIIANAGKFDIEEVKKAKYLASSYSNFQDVWPPACKTVTSKIDYNWPNDLVVNEDGEWMRGWVLKKNDNEYPGGVLCSIPALELAKQSMEEGKLKGFNARFVDTITSTQWRECYNTHHSTTRSEDMAYRMKILEFGDALGLVIGAENGVDCAVPYCKYFEGMMSEGIGRLPGAGYNFKGDRYAEPTESFLKYQMGYKYRVPLWELVYHDCVVTTWYWGDSSNVIPEVWDRRDLFNILYGNMPLWAIPNATYWEKYKTRFIECYNNVCPVFEKVGYNAMLAHNFVTSDCNVQETIFSGDIRIVVNFGDKEYKLSDVNCIVPAKGFVVFEKGNVWKKGICTTPEILPHDKKIGA